MAIHIQRRKFVTLVGGAAASWPLASRAQQPTLPVIGFMSTRSPEDHRDVVAAFRRGLGEGGRIEGKNVIVEFRWAYADSDEVARAIRDDVARYSDMMSPGVRCLAGG
jgi:putative tryptophan/tyrosine transport system substrate-binding protein